MKKAQPTGPYLISGYSSGSAIAFEMALQLELEGESVRKLLLLDGSPNYGGMHLTTTYMVCMLKTMNLLSNVSEDDLMVSCSSNYNAYVHKILNIWNLLTFSDV